MKPPPLARQRLRAWRHMGQSALMHRVRPTWIPRPHVGYLLVTWRCNCQCRTCNAWKNTGEGEVTTDEWLRFFRDARSLDIVKILGGEPFSRPDILQLLRGVRDIINPYIMQVTTNGTDTDTIARVVEQIAWPGLQIRVSIDGLEQTHDTMRGFEGGWSSAVRTLEALAVLKRRFGFKVGMNYALKDESIGEYDDVLALSRRVGADLIPGVNVAPFLEGSVPPEQVRSRFVGLQDVRRALPLLENPSAGTRRQLPGVDHLLSRLVTGHVFRKEILEDRLDFTCRALRDILYVLPKGEVVRCGIDHRPVGNIRHQRLEEIWHGAPAHQMRQRVDACPGCLQASIHILSRFYTGRLLD